MLIILIACGVGGEILNFNVSIENTSGASHLSCEAFEK